MRSPPTTSRRYAPPVQATAHPKTLKGVACEHCEATDTPVMQGSPRGGFLCAPGYGCGRGMSFAEVAGPAPGGPLYDRDDEPVRAR